MMNFGILAAGNGSRLAADGVTTPKPLAEVGGTPLMARLADAMRACGPHSVAVVTNARMAAVRDFALTLDFGTPRVCVEAVSTASPAESLACLLDMLPDGKAIICTTDTVIARDSLAAFATVFARTGCTGIAGVTAMPGPACQALFVDTAPDGTVTAFSDSASASTRFISAGIYGLVLPAARRIAHTYGLRRLRDFQRLWLASTPGLHTFDVGPAFDIDCAADLTLARKYFDR